MSFSDEYWMQQALEQARMAWADNEIPVGAILLKNEEIVLTEYNRTRQKFNGLAHAEKLIIDKIVGQGEKFLYDYTLYVTLEPCLMCAGMMIWARLGRLVYGARDPKSGVVGSVYNVFEGKKFNHRPLFSGGILEQECGQILKDFFVEKRKTESCQSG